MRSRVEIESEIAVDIKNLRIIVELLLDIREQNEEMKEYLKHKR